MIVKRASSERGHFDHGWLDTYHSFSFGDYHDPKHMGFRSLRVINDDRVKPGVGFPTHPHRDMEILTYILEGELAHQDSMGNGSSIRPGDVQRMSAGTGVQHSEKNPSRENPVHLLQIWILPAQKGLPPGYEQKHFPATERRGTLKLIASRDARSGSVRIHQDADLYATVLESGQSVQHEFAPGRFGWLQVARGSVRVSGETYEQGDGAAISNERAIAIAADGPAELLLFDLA